MLKCIVSWVAKCNNGITSKKLSRFLFFFDFFFGLYFFNISTLNNLLSKYNFYQVYNNEDIVLLWLIFLHDWNFELLWILIV